ncbi:ABC transporter substrate-binding protein [Caballeronia sp. J97]|uniref:ABC transporter substrate-binding protein n=1 Tax=Caballeronia sp. J97 TaxID=2805429 RepID=UPI002AB2CD4D|nr:ABC transporter substrate-binding protein [Caballeronia sp. J97]
MLKIRKLSRKIFKVPSVFVILFTCISVASFSAHSAEILNVAIVSRTVFYAPLWIALNQGYLEEENIRAKIDVFDNAEKLNAALLSGQSQISISTPESVILNAYTGGPLRIIAGNAKRLPHFIIAKPEIKRLDQLKGANVGVLSIHEGTTYLVKEIVKSAGLHPDDVKISAVGGAPSRWKLLREGKIDMGLQPFPLSYEAEALGYSNLGAVSTYIPDWQFTSVNVDDRWARTHEQTVVAFLRALKRGQDYMDAHPDIAADIAATELQTSKTLAARALSDTSRLSILDANLNISRPGLQRVFASLKDTTQLPDDASLDFDRILDLRFLRQSQEIAVKDLGSFFVGGEQKVITGLPTREVRYAAAAPPLKLDPNGTYQTGQVYVEFTRLMRPRARMPVLFLNGGTLTGAMWKTTPDGRPGWESFFLHEGYDTYLTDGVGKGRASWSQYPEIFPVAPIFRPNEETWSLLRIGPHYANDQKESKAFDGVKFPVDHFEDLAKEGVPRFAGLDDVELKSYEALIDRVCPCAIIAQSSGAYFALLLAERHPDLIKAVAAVELTAAPPVDARDFSVLKKVPQLLLWGDNQQEFASWRRIRTNVDAYADAVKKDGGNLQVIDLPSVGIRGNTHQMMMDKNSDQIAGMISDWLDKLTKQ